VLSVGPPLEKAGWRKVAHFLCYFDLSLIISVRYLDNNTMCVELILYLIDRDVVIPVGNNCQLCPLLFNSYKL